MVEPLYVGEKVVAANVVRGGGGGGKNGVVRCEGGEGGKVGVE